MEYQQYLDEKIHQLRIICQAQWDYLTFLDISSWLDDNFKDDLEGKYYATKILLHTIYYRKKDIETLLNFGLNEKIYGVFLKERLIKNNNIYINNSESSAQILKMKKASFFIPLLDRKKPHESGNGVIGDLVHKINVSEDQVDFDWNVTEAKLKDKQFLIFVDDCIGSGKQLKNYWNSTELQGIRDTCKKYKIKIYYLVLVAYQKNIEKLINSHELNDIKVIVCDILTDKHRIFSDENIIWEHTDSFNERDQVLEYFKNLKKRKGISFLGYKKLDFAVILHDRLPNWSFPLFWKEMTGWKILLKRKTSS